MSRIVLATGNAGKLAEFRQLLANTGFEIEPQSAFNMPEAIESGLSFVENAIIKARNAAQHSGLPAIADDSGLEVDALAGAPGIYSARFAGAKASDADPDSLNNALLLQKLVGVPESLRTARYQCVLVFMRHAADPSPLICQSSWEGRIAEAPRGDGGFGYDPLFWLPELNCSAAELAPADKNQRSHRGRAMIALLAALTR